MQTQLLQQIKNSEITDIICPETKKPIFADDTAYILNYVWYHQNADIDKVIQEHTKDPEMTADKLYSDDDDYFCFTTYHEPEEVEEDILNNGYFYNTAGEKINL